MPAYQVVQKRQPGSVEKSPPKRAFLRQNTHPVPPLYAASDGCFKASLSPVRVLNALKKASGPSKKRKKPSSQEGRGSSVTCKRLQQ